MTIGAILTGIFGVWLLILVPALLSLGWLQAKLVLVALLVAYHVWCAVIVRDFRKEQNRHSETWFRWFNEAPSLLLIAIVVLAIVKPF